MEVHAHTHTARKKWTHYFWEFLMLFLAVFCGFLAENFREHQVEHQREKQFMATLSEDLKDDIALADEQITTHKQKILQNDSLIELLNINNPELVNRNDLYYFARIGNRTVFFYNNDRTIEQLKSSGGLRLIRKKNVSYEIMRYYRKIEELKMVENYDAEEQAGYKELAVKIFDPIVFKNMSRTLIIQRLNNNPKLLTTDHSQLTEFSGKVQYLNGSRIRQLNMKEDIRKSALSLIELLREEYHLE